MKKNFNCLQAQQFLQKEPDANTTINAALHDHLAHCAQCRNLADEIEATLNATQPLPFPEPDPFFVTRFEARLLHEQQPFTRLIIKFLQPALATAALAIAITGGVLLGELINNQLPDTTNQHESQAFASDYNLIDEPTDALLQLLDNTNN